MVVSFLRFSNLILLEILRMMSVLSAEVLGRIVRGIG